MYLKNKLLLRLYLKNKLLTKIYIYLKNRLPQIYRILVKSLS